MNRTAIAAALAVATAAGCADKKETPPPASTLAGEPAGGPEADSPYTDGPAGEFGVPECDRFAAKYLACLEKVPEGGRALARQTFEQTIEHWRLVASNPERRASLAAACAQQEKATRAAMERYDCDW